MVNNKENLSDKKLEEFSAYRMVLTENIKMSRERLRIAKVQKERIIAEVSYLESEIKSMQKEMQMIEFRKVVKNVKKNRL